MAYSEVIHDWVNNVGRRWAASFLRTGRTDADEYFEMMVRCGGPIVQSLRAEARKGFDAARAERKAGAS